MSSRMAIAVFLLLLLQTSMASACDKTSPGCKVDKEPWLRFMKSALTGPFCMEGGPFLRCYEMDQAKCITLTMKFTDECIAESRPKIPKLMSDPDFKKWGSVIGACAGDRLTDAVHLKQGKSDDCALQQP